MSLWNGSDASMVAAITAAPSPTRDCRSEQPGDLVMPAETRCDGSEDKLLDGSDRLELSTIAESSHRNSESATSRWETSS